MRVGGWGRKQGSQGEGEGERQQHERRGVGFRAPFTAAQGVDAAGDPLACVADEPDRRADHREHQEDRCRHNQANETLAACE